MLTPSEGVYYGLQIRLNIGPMTWTDDGSYVLLRLVPVFSFILKKKKKKKKALCQGRGLSAISQMILTISSGIFRNGE